MRKVAKTHRFVRGKRQKSLGETAKCEEGGLSKDFPEWFHQKIVRHGHCGQYKKYRFFGKVAKHEEGVNNLKKGLGGASWKKW